MRYLYGDSTPSPLQSNFLAYVRDLLDFCVHLLLAQQKINALRNERIALDQHTDAERMRIGGLRALMNEACEAANTDGEESMSMRAVKRVLTAGDREIERTLEELKAKLDTDRAGLHGNDRDERDSCLDAFGKWIALHAPHEGTWGLSAHLDDGGHFQGETSGIAPYGLQWKCAIEMPSGHPMANGIKVGDLVTQIEMPLPEPSGWLKKGKLKPQRIDAYSIDSFATDGNRFHYELRSTPHAASGLDVDIRGNSVEVMLAGAKEATGVDVSVDDRQRLLTLRDRIVEALTTHKSVRRRVVEATIDKKPLADGEDLGDVAKRLIDAAEPIVTQIRTHSLSPNELVIRRLLGDDRREEVFVSVASLLDKVGHLPRPLRGAFAALGLDGHRARTPVAGVPFVEPPRETPRGPHDAEPAVPSIKLEKKVEVDPETEKKVQVEPDVPSIKTENRVEANSDAKVEVDRGSTTKSNGEPARSDAKDAAAPAALGGASASKGAGSTSSSPSVTVPSSSAEIPAASASASLSALVTIDAHTKEALAATVKRIVHAAREGRTKEAYESYAALFEDNGFANQRPQDQRQVLKLVVLSKTPPPSSEAVLHAYSAALIRLTALAAGEGSDPIDQEMITVCEDRLTS